MLGFFRPPELSSVLPDASAPTTQLRHGGDHARGPSHSRHLAEKLADQEEGIATEYRHLNTNAKVLDTRVCL